VSGRYALQGRQVIAGLQAWAEAVNEGGGLRVHGAGARAPVRLVYYDDASSPTRAAANAERLLDADAVEVLIGPYASDLTRAVLPVATAVEESSGTTAGPPTTSTWCAVAP
jgi:branched-chain amino acid transport system substrate-binding protein